MFKTTLKTTLIAGALALGGIVTMSGAATAADYGGGTPKLVYNSGFGVSIGFGDRAPRRHYRHGPRFDRWDSWDRYERPRRQRVRSKCKPRKALRKARKEGVRKGHVLRVNRRGIVVAGRIDGQRVRIAFKNNRHCSVRFVKALY